MDYRKIYIFYFSGTGNAKQIATWFSELTVEKGTECQLFNMAETDVKSIDYIDPQDLLIFIAPIHGFNYPKTALRFIRKFPKGKNRIVLMCTRGGTRIGPLLIPGITGAAFIVSSIILKIKGYVVAGQVPFDMPTNWTSLHPAPGDKTMKSILEKNQIRVRKHFEIIYSGKNDYAARKEVILDIITGIPSFAYLYWGRFFLSKTLYASSKCTQCNLCVRDCPVKAITIVDKRPYWSIKCESCMHCINICPFRAIEAAHGLLVLVFYLWIVGTPILMGLLPLLFHHWLIAFLVFDVLLFFGLLFLLYRFQHFLLKNRTVAKIIAYTSLTHYKFWRRYKQFEYQDFKSNYK